MSKPSGIPRLSQIKKPINKPLEEMTNEDEELSLEQMKDALTNISLELQRFQNGDTSDELSNSGKENVYRSKLKLKRKQIQSLKENLNTACMVAKTLTSSKEKEYTSINKHLNVARNETVALQKKNAEDQDTIQKLNTDKQALTSKFQHLKNFIELGYKELQNINKTEEKDLPIELQLKEIIVNCGQFYADFCNEHEKCIQLEQKNRFLGNKLSILQRNLEEATAELKNYQNRDKSKSSEKKENIIDLKAGCVRSEYNFSQEINVGHVMIQPVLNNYQSERQTRGAALDLTSHISLVKDLLTDQDSMLYELKLLSDELNCLTY